LQEEIILLKKWQVQEIAAGVEEADNGKFAEETEVERVLNKWF
jgi:predicted transcriptional regulator